MELLKNKAQMHLSVCKCYVDKIVTVLLSSNLLQIRTKQNCNSSST